MNYRCLQCGHERSSDYPPQFLHRRCRVGPSLECVYLEVSGPINPTEPPRSRKYLGDCVETALTRVGITKERVTKWLGRECNCDERREMLNRVHRWAERKLKGLFKSDREAIKALEEMME